MIEILGPDAVLQLDVWDAPPPECPAVGCALDHGGRRLLWSGPGVWWIRTTPEDRAAALASWRGAVGEGGVVSDLSGGFTRVRISGPRWRETLMIEGVFDAESPDFAPGCAAGTVIDHVPVRLDVVAADAVDVYAPRSLAPHLLALWASA